MSVRGAAEASPAMTWLAGGGEMGERMRALDWAKTPLGSIDRWPQSLRSAISTCIGSRFPIVLYWGPQLVVLYNDAYAEILGGKHPWALGRPCSEVWSEIWDVIAPMLDGVVTTGQATWSEDQLLVLERRGYPEECYFSFSFSPVRGEDGGVDGVFTAVIESTGRVLGERRLALLTELAAHSAARSARPSNGDARRQAGRAVRARLFDRRQRRGAHRRNAGCRGGAGRRAASARTGAADCRRTARDRRKPASPARRAAVGIPAAGRRAAQHRDYERESIRGGAPARRSARGTRPCEDGVLLEREPRVPHAAHAAARAARGRACRCAACAAAAPARARRADAPQRPAAAAPSQYTPRVLAYRGGPRTGELC